MPPPLDEVILGLYSTSRFDIAKQFGGVGKKHFGPAAEVFLTDKNASGATLYGVAAFPQPLHRCCSKGISDYIKTSPISVYITKDDPIPNDPSTWALSDSEARGGARLFVTNPTQRAHALAGEVGFMPWGVKNTTKVRASVGATHERPPAARDNLMLCCCMHDRMKRSDRATAFQKRGLCPDYIAKKEFLKKKFPEVIEMQSTARFVWSPRGVGVACFRDLEVLYSGAVPVMDDDGAKAKHAWWADLPHLFIHNDDSSDKFNFRPADDAIDKQALEAEWALIVAREERGGYDARQMYWPYHLYELTRHFPDDPPRAPFIMDRAAERRRTEAESDAHLLNPKIDRDAFWAVKA